MRFQPQSAHTIFAAESLQDPLEEIYGIDIQSVQLLHHGMNDSYIVKTKVEEYVFRAAHLDWRTEEQLQAEIDILRELGKSRVAVCLPVMLRSGDWLCKIEAPEGVRLGTLFHRAPGNLPKDLTPAICTSMGATLAQLHRVLKNKAFDHRPKFNRQTLFEEPAAIIKATFPDLEVETLLSSMEELLPSFADLEPGWLHGDYIPVNLNEFVGEITLYDFDLSGHGPLAYDLACFKAAAESYPQDTRDSWNLFIDAYERSCGPKCDDHFIDRLVMLRKLWVWAYNVKYGEDFRRLNPHSVQHHVQQFQQLVTTIRGGK